ncbi:MAG: 50S ribosomal protein L5 [Patescibacteria group bacterium]
MKSNLYKKYKEIVPLLKDELGLANIMQVPKIEKVIINVGYGRHNKEKAYIERIEETIKIITSQKPIRNLAKKSISNFKIREGAPVGSSVTLRGDKMYDFLYKLINFTLPRVKDFRGLNPKSFDGRGNYTIGFKEQLAFPEISGDAADQIHGLEVVISTSANDNKTGRALLEKIGLPFKKDK